MARVKITEAVLGRDSDGFLLGLDEASVQVNDSDGDAATVYADATGDTTLTNPLTSDNGRLPGYLNEGRYELVVTYDGVTADAVPFEARAGYPDAPSGSSSVLTNDGSGSVEWSDPNDVVGLVPWTIDISPYGTPATQTNWSTIGADNTALTAARLVSSGAQNAEVGWDVVVGAGTWTFSLIHTTQNNAGIYTVSLDGVSQGTIDGYAAISAVNNVSTLTGLEVATTGKKRLLLKMATKNASSTNYYGAIHHVKLTRTA